MIMDDILFTIRVCFQTGSFQEKCCKQKKRPICETSRFNNILWSITNHASHTNLELTATKNLYLIYFFSLLVQMF